VIVPAPVGLTGAVGAGGGLLSGLAALIKGTGGGAAAGGAGTAAGGGGATLIGGLGAKSAALCVSAACAAGGVVVVAEETVLHRDGDRPATAASASSKRAPTRAPKETKATTKPAAAISQRSPRVSSNSTGSRGRSTNRESAQRVPELGIEPELATAAASTSQTQTPASLPTAKPQSTSAAHVAQAAEFGIEGP
jgi:hypothetical protein